MPELVDALDSSGSPTGQLKTKEQIFADGDWRRVVHVWVVNSRGEVLTQLRAKGRKMWDNTWDVSMGGGIAAGETSRQAGVRELMEELGLQVKEDELVSLGTWDTSKMITERGQMSQELSDTYMLRRDVDAAQLTLQPSEVAEARNMSLADMEAAIRSDEQYAAWVPHPRTYYLRVIATIQEYEVA